VRIADDVSAYDVSGSNIYYVQGSNNLVFRVATNGQSQKEQITSDFPEEGKNVSKIIIYDENRIGLISKDKNFYIFNKGEHDNYFRKIGSDVEGMYFSDDGKKLLFWTDYEISVYFLRDWQVQPIRSENDLANITRYSEPIKNVQWFNDYEHVIFSTGRWTKIIELDPRDHRNCLDLINTTLETPQVVYNSYQEILYFTETKDNSTILESIIFPEPTPILGIGG
jgi:hypothetical protein